MTSIPLTPQIEKAYTLAKEARLRAHAPYSKFLVGACFKIKDKEEYVVGSNVENASYGGTICAEQSAIVSMVSKLGKQNLEFLLVVTQADPPAYPCGRCLQVLSEFCPGAFPIYIGNLNEIKFQTTLNDLMPKRFTDF